MKLSTKDLLILLGIVVAVIITLTTLVYSDHTATKAEVPMLRKTSFYQASGEFLQKLVKNTSTRPLSRQ